MDNKNLITSFMVFSIIFSTSVLALPCAFFGTAKLNDNPINGTLVTAHLNSTGELLATAEEVSGLGSYSIVIDSADNYVRFKIAGIWANEPEQLCASGGHTYLNLTASTLPDGSPCTSDMSCNSTFCVHDVCRPTDPYAGDGFCDTGENCANSPTDCQCPGGLTCSAGICIAPSGPAPSGPGGGSYISCTENWTCTEWSGCAAGKQTRTCTENNCGTNKSRPIESQDCVSQCTENWSCPEWSTIVCINGEQTRDCADLSNCGTIVNRPILTQACESGQQQEEQKTEQAEISPASGLFLGLTTIEWTTGAIVGLIAAIVIIFLAKRKKSKK